MLSEKGSLKDTPLLKLLLSIHEQGLTGILYVKNEEELKVIYLSRGKLTWAISNSDGDKLENILLQRNQVDKEVLNKIKRDARVSDSIGKILVEQGLITLEELIESSREQLRRIIASLLKWKDGGFQFVRDTPPERLISLDLSVTDFIIRFILEEVDISEIWKKIGSLQVEFIKNPDTDKMEKYRLSVKQRQLLDGFTGDIRLETVLSRYTGGHRESLLKIIYFFLVAELLIKKEFELNDSSDFDDSGFDYFREEEGESASGASGKFNSVSAVGGGAPGAESLIPVAPRKTTGEGYTLGAPPLRLEKPVSSGDTGEIPPMKKAKPPKPLFSGPEESETRKNAKLLTLVMVSVTLILGGVIMLLLLGYFNESPSLEDLVKASGARPGSGAQAGKAAEDRDIIQLEEKKTVAAPEGKKPVPEDSPVSAAGTDTKKNPATQDPALAVKKVDPATGDASGTAQKPDAAQQNKTGEAQPPVTAPPATSSEKGARTAYDYMMEGSLTTAADVWKRQIIREKIRYSILLELDCQKESVLNAASQFSDKTAFFLLPRKTSSRLCYLVMFGRFKTQEEARKGLERVPAYFWKQPNPPQVIDVGVYL